ncbi:MAG TPA: NUDIX hydrolase [Candidatus Saccharimonadales bacterium]|jgi:8-oxo-dGTP pyrophosphatase MutT (NUDIX family)|nr:NUDIX hydrolase [Candidatus Saccharimonadales bacterium]
MKKLKIDLRNAKKDKLFYFVVNVVIVRRQDKRCLILKRDDREKVHPGKWAIPGGKLEWADLDVNKPTRVNGAVLDFENAVEALAIREIKEEAGIEIQLPLHYINNIAFIRPDGVPVILINFAVEYKSGGVKPEKGSFTDFAWVNHSEAKKYPCILGIPDEIKNAIRVLTKAKA